MWGGVGWCGVVPFTESLMNSLPHKKVCKWERVRADWWRPQVVARCNQRPYIGETVHSALNL